MFFKKANVPFEGKVVDLLRGEWISYYIIIGNYLFIYFNILHDMSLL